MSDLAEEMSAESHIPHILNLSNSIIGVTILAMPFCYKECGMVLGTVLLFFCTWLTLSSCKMLMKAGLSSKKKSYGFLAYYTHGSPGKIAVEVGLIGLQFGTLVAQIVIIGDLGPAIISKFTGMENSSRLRTALIIVLCLCIGLPLGLLKNLSAVSKASTLCICFYSVFVVYVISLSLPNLIAGNWYNRVKLWRTEGLFKCLPIFSFAFGCQTQLFHMYDSMADPSLKGVNSIISSAVNLCTCSYLLVGFFGYVSFCDTDITGDIINHLPSTFVADVLKLGFVISIAITFPLIIFPCRASLYTLFFPQRKSSEDMEQRPVLPEIHFKVITVIIVVAAVITGILVPNVEFVLAINGATMGTLICYIFPAIFFLKVMTGSSDGKTLAQFVFVCGFTIMLLCTYTTLNSQDKGHATKPINPDSLLKPANVLPIVKRDDAGLKDLINKKPALKEKVVIKESRVEPPNPQAPLENSTEPMNKSASDKIDDKQKLNVSLKNKKEDTANQIAAGGQIKDKKKDEVKVDDKQKVDATKTKKIEEEKKKDESLDKQNKILLELKKQHEEQQRLINEQKKILAELKEHQEEKHKDEQAKELQQPQQHQGGLNLQPQAGVEKQIIQQPVPQQQQAGRNLPQQAGLNQQQQVGLNQPQPVGVEKQNVQQPLQQQGGLNPQQQAVLGNRNVQQQVAQQAGAAPVVQNEQQQVAQQAGAAPVVQNALQQPIIQQESKLNVPVKQAEGDKTFIHQSDKYREGRNLNIAQQGQDDKVKVEKKDNVLESDRRLKRDIDNVLKSKDKDVKSKTKDKTKDIKQKDVNDEMKRRLLSEHKIKNNMDTVIKSR